MKHVRDVFLVGVISLLRKLKPGKRKSWDEVPSAILISLGLIATLQASYHGYILGKFGPGFLELANGQSIAAWWNPAFLFCVVILGATGVQAVIWGFVATGCFDLLKKRVFAC